MGRMEARAYVEFGSSDSNRSIVEGIPVFGTSEFWFGSDGGEIWVPER